MSKAYSIDLCRRVHDIIDDGFSTYKPARRFHIGVANIVFCGIGSGVIFGNR